MSLTKRRKRLLLMIGGLLAAIILLVPLPLTVDEADLEAAASHAIRSIVYDKLVINTTSGIGRLYDTSFVSEDKQLYFRNELGIPDDVFLRHCLKPMPAGFEPDFQSGDVILSFSKNRSDSRQIWFSYTFGSLGAQGYAIEIRQSLLTRFFVYSHEWVS